MIDVYIASIQNAVLHRRAAVGIELAVAMCLAHDFREDCVDARVNLVHLYATCGFDCLAPDGGDYKTINRRVNAAMRLFEKLGADAVAAALGRTVGHRRVEAAQALLAPLNLHTMVDVLTFVNPPAPPVTRATRAPSVKHARRAADAPDLQHVRTAHIDVAIPPAATRGELLQLVARLLKLADAIEPLKGSHPVPA